MTIEFAIKALVVAALVILAYWVFRRFEAPRAGTQRLAITVWAAFGPYDSADTAADSLRWASRAVFGKTGATEHQEWMEGHIQNFCRWQAESRFPALHEVMRKGLLLTAYGHAFETACQRFRDEAMTDATDIMGHLNKNLEKTEIGRASCRERV